MIRYAQLDEQKVTGSTYTPAELANFVARQMYSAAELPKSGLIRILDPAIGDGALVHALLSQLPKSQLKRTLVRGFDTNSDALAQATAMLEGDFPLAEIELVHEDFLSKYCGGGSDGDLFAGDSSEEYELVIANPPYVRTQVLGAKHAQQIARRFELKGRVDLYYPFLLAISEVLAQEGVAGVITSNRFMTTKSGESVRAEVLSRFDLIKVWDLGDTKLFDAAVLPAVMVARKLIRGKNCASSAAQFTKVYEDPSPVVEELNPVSSILDAISAPENGRITTPDGKSFMVSTGSLSNSDKPTGVWRVANATSDKWLQTVRELTWSNFGQQFNIRVGVKTTADKVFIRSDWEDLPGGCPELVKPLLTRHHAHRFKAKAPARQKLDKKILYPHEVTDQGRGPVDLLKYPISREYLESNRERLESRKYVIDAGREWYEIWVPQDPESWSRPKLVFPDISERPMFFMDMSGGVVNGECYWMQPMEHANEELLWLALAVANSNFIEEFYDHSFHNKLYSGRRRFITQYVEKFPLPDPTLASSKELVRLAKSIFELSPSEEAEELSSKLNSMIWTIFGLPGEEVRG